MKRKTVVKAAKQIKSHDEVVVSYNKINPLPVGYVLKVSDDWCAAFVTVAFNNCGYKLINECSVPRMIELAKKNKIYKNCSYKPKIGDVIIYDWDTVKDGDHVGIITDIDNDLLTVIEGNKSGTIGYRVIYINNACISGFITPKYDDNTPLQNYNSIDDIVNAIIKGEFGNGDDRKNNLYNYFQEKVNEKLK